MKFTFHGTKTDYKQTFQYEQAGAGQWPVCQNFAQSM